MNKYQKEFLIMLGFLAYFFVIIYLGGNIVFSKDPSTLLFTSFYISIVVPLIFTFFHLGGKK